MAVRPIDAIELQKRMCALCNQDYADEPCEPSDCIFIRALNETPTLTQPNEPLTLEELRKMDRHPVWVKLLKPNKYINPPAGWRILEKSLAGTFGVWDGEDSLIERHYGTDWLAYRRPPEGEEETYA